MALATLLAGAAVSCVAQDPAQRIALALDVCTLSDDGALCDDGHPCTINDVCVNKVCVGTPVPDRTPCTDGDFCTIGDICLSSVCTGTPAPDGYPCTDEDVCTEPDSCAAGKCRPGPARSCDDGDPCTIDMCVPATGCVSSARECVPVPDAVADRGAETSLPDARDAIPDSALDVSPSDGVTQPDGVVPPDAGLDVGVDVGADVASDLSADRIDDGLVETLADASGDGEGGGDAADGGDDDVPAPHDLRAHGGACNCALDPTAPAAAPLALLAGVAGLFRLRRRRRAA